MDKNHSELFGRLSYDESLSYEQLLDTEAGLTTALEELLLRAGAAHLDFTPLGDALLFQCAFEAHKLYVYRKIAQETAKILPQGVTGRLLCLDKSLDALHIYWMQTGQWQEEARPVPENPPQNLQNRRIDCADGTHEED
ncbi:hypothetical protein [Desulfovibrio sp. ZJ369]|uniref:hypothetical protein n=1 Tax=Desulfovibrio sp. ZJ369 TaxID=2709793 RepID=UPI0013EA9898|nr:hypothetical protein [Desulfovibrio sp. ZJ369]